MRSRKIISDGKKLVSETEKRWSASEKTHFVVEMIFSPLKMIASITQNIGFRFRKPFSKRTKIDSHLKIIFFFSQKTYFFSQKTFFVT